MNADFQPPHRIQLQGSALASKVLAAWGWRVVFEGLPARQGVLIAYPHTSNWDFVVLVLAKWAVGLQVSFWAKDTLFRIPGFGAWLRWIGGIPVLRQRSGGVVAQAVETIAQHKSNDSYFWLGLSPEGTRRFVNGWRSGFYQSAVQGQVPLCVVALDFGKREVRANSFLRLLGEPEADLQRIRVLLADARGKIPSNASPVRLLNP